MPRFIRNMWPAIVWLSGILILTLLPGNYFPGLTGFWSLFSSDKLIHVILFAGLSYLMVKGLIKQYPAGKLRYIYALVALFGILFAVFTEVLQWHLPVKRDGNVYDTLANVAGVFTGFGLLFFLRINIRKNKNQIKN